MFQINPTTYPNHPQLHSEVVNCVTAVILDHVEDYLLTIKDNVDDHDVYKFVAPYKINELVPDVVQQQLKSLGFDPHEFIAKKIGQLQVLLLADAEIAHDPFIDYLIFRMLLNPQSVGFLRQSDLRQDKAKYTRIYTQVLDYVGTLAPENMDTDDLMLLADDHMDLITCFDLYAGDQYGNSVVLHNQDYSLFEEWGVEQVLQSMAYGALTTKRYGIDYVTTMFTSIGYTLPAALVIPQIDC